MLLVQRNHLVEISYIQCYFVLTKSLVEQVARIFSQISV